MRKILLSVLIVVSLITIAAPSIGAPDHGSEAAGRAAKGDHVVGYGRIGSVKVGMSKARAYRTGLLNKDVPLKSCPPAKLPLQPKGGWKRHYDVVVIKGRVFELGVLSKRLRTANGSGVGTSLKVLRKRYGSRLSAPRAAGYDQQAVFVSKGTGKARKWIGFLLSTESYSGDAVVPSDRVIFMAVTRGKRPRLMRDGC